MATFHAYVHVPFCRVRCGYCDFNTYTATELNGYPQTAFLSHLRAEIALSLEQVGRRELETVFFGGGTPTLLPASELVEALSVLVESFGLAVGAEITTEANPDSVDENYLRELRDGGFTRVSFGMQSAVPEVLATLDRTHDPDSVAKNVLLAKNQGFKTSVDLIYGAPSETMDQWKISVEAALAMEPDHISAYALIIEPGTKLARQIGTGEKPLPDEDLQADKYEWLESRLEREGFHWYELSNWSKSGEGNSGHNMAYWRGQDWWGFGPGAHSHVAGRRWSNVKHPSNYAQLLLDGSVPSVDMELLTETQQLEERAMLGLRLREGLDLDVVRRLNPQSAQPISEMVAEELIDGRAALQGRAVLTLKGRLLADLVLRKILGL